METKQRNEGLVLPVVHMNGTGKDTLLEQREAVYMALRGVEKALRQMSPNGRDYYVIPGLLPKAQAQHELRMAIIKALMDEMVQECKWIEGRMT